MSEPRVKTLAVPPLEKSILVRCAPARAFDAFTAEIAQWWPIKTHSVGQAKARTVSIEPAIGGRVYETAEDGSEFEWGRVQSWSPPHGFSMTWHPGRSADDCQLLELSFAPEAGATRVRLVHRGWEKLGASGQAKRDDYAGGWDKILSQDFAGYLGGAS